MVLIAACATATASPTPLPPALPTDEAAAVIAVANPTVERRTTPKLTTVAPSWDPQAGVPVEYPPRVVTEQPYVAFAEIGPVVLVHPSDQVEVIGFHESGHDGAQQMEPTATAAAPFTMETRDRDTVSRGAADIAVHPDREIRSPVSGVVKRSGTYVLYCEYSDDFAVIEPDARPGWEVKILHIDGVQVFRGDRVEAGVTVIAQGPTPLPFRSQVDDATSAPSWPHVHIEVVDPSIPDRPSGGGC